MLKLTVIGQTGQFVIECEKHHIFTSIGVNIFSDGIDFSFWENRKVKYRTARELTEYELIFNNGLPCQIINIE